MKYHSSFLGFPSCTTGGSPVLAGPMDPAPIRTQKTRRRSMRPSMRLIMRGRCIIMRH